MNKKEKALNLLVRFMKEAQGNTTLGERADTADKYAEEIVKLFAIPVVVGRSEQLKAYAEYLQTRPDFQERSNKDLAIDYCDSL